MIGSRITIAPDHSHAGKSGVIVSEWTGVPAWEWLVELDPPDEDCAQCGESTGIWPDTCPVHGEYEGHRCAIRTSDAITG